MRRFSGWLAALLILVSAGTAVSQTVTPAGPEFLVNTYTTSYQAQPAVASEPGGNFVVVWKSKGPDGAGYGIFGQRFSGMGDRVGAEFRVSSYTPGDQARPAVSSDTTGRFVVVWQSFGQDGDNYGIFGQRFVGSGAPLGTEFRVNTYTASIQSHPAIALDPAGNFVVVWQSLGSSDGVFAQRYSSSAAPLGPEFRVNTTVDSSQASPSVASHSAGNFVVVWESPQDGSYTGIFGQRYSSVGAPLGTEFRVNSYTTDVQDSPAVAPGPGGGFVVVWRSNQDPAPFGYSGIFGQRYSSLGAPAGNEFQVNTYLTNYQLFPAIASDSSGNFVVTWESQGQDASGYGVFGRRYSSTGAALGPEFPINTFTTGDQFIPAIGSGANGDFVVVWQSNLQDGDFAGIFGQRYCVNAPTVTAPSALTTAQTVCQ